MGSSGLGSVDAARHTGNAEDDAVMVECRIDGHYGLGELGGQTWEAVD